MIIIAGISTMSRGVLNISYHFLLEMLSDFSHLPSLSTHTIRYFFLQEYELLNRFNYLFHFLDFILRDISSSVPTSFRI